jgi:hypothetical protein
MTNVNRLVRAESLKDVQFWQEQNGTWTTTTIFKDKNGETIAFEIPESILEEIKSTHGRFIASGKRLEKSATA